MKINSYIIFKHQLLACSLRFCVCGKIRSLHLRRIDRSPKWLEFNGIMGWTLIAPSGLLKGCLSKLVYIWEATVGEAVDTKHRKMKRV